jgi:hypothetical protein
MEYQVLYPQVGQSLSGLANAMKPFLPSIGNILYPISKIYISVGCNVESRVTTLLLFTAPSVNAGGGFERISLIL